MPKKRPLSEFLARELLYDYITGQLDTEKSIAVEECLRTGDDIPNDHRALTEGIKYCDSLSQTQLSEPFLTRLITPEKKWHDLVKAWKKTPAPIRIGVESLVIAAFIGVVILVLPKEYLPWKQSTTYTLVEVKKEKTTEANEASVASPPSVVVSETVVTTTLVEEVPKVAVAQSPKVEVAMKPAPIQTTQPAQQSVNTTVQAKGLLYRVYMSSDQIDELTPQMVQKITALGAERAGEVQLGWRREQGSYFHFSMPEANYEELTNYLQTLGPVRIVKEPHRRVMPAGQIRLILWLEMTKQGKSTTNDSSQTEVAE